MKSIVVLYHSNCFDGFGAAYAAWKKFGNRVEYIAIRALELPTKRLLNKEIYVLDSSFYRDTQRALMKKNKSVVVIDHHGSSRKDVESFPQNVFDNDHSGAVLSWRFFHPKKPVPVLLRYVENADLYRWKMPFGLEISAYLASEKFDFKVWDKLAHEFEKKKNIKKYALYGRVVLRYSDRLIEEIIKKADLVRFEGYRALAANSSSKKLTSALGNTLSKKQPPIGIVWYKDKEKLGVSLRSNGSMDVSKLARKYGGGGHKAAAAFTLPWRRGFPWKVIKK